jgi:hypothetical protein
LYLLIISPPGTTIALSGSSDTLVQTCAAPCPNDAKCFLNDAEQSPKVSQMFRERYPKRRFWQQSSDRGRLFFAGGSTANPESVYRQRNLPNLLNLPKSGAKDMSHVSGNNKPDAVLDPVFAQTSDVLRLVFKTDVAKVAEMKHKMVNAQAKAAEMSRNLAQTSDVLRLAFKTDVAKVAEMKHKMVNVQAKAAEISRNLLRRETLKSSVLRPPSLPAPTSIAATSIAATLGANPFVSAAVMAEAMAAAIAATNIAPTSITATSIAATLGVSPVGSVGKSCRECRQSHGQCRQCRAAMSEATAAAMAATSASPALGTAATPTATATAKTSTTATVQPVAVSGGTSTRPPAGLASASSISKIRDQHRAAELASRMVANPNPGSNLSRNPGSNPSPNPSSNPSSNPRPNPSEAATPAKVYVQGSVTDLHRPLCPFQVTKKYTK